MYMSLKNILSLMSASEQNKTCASIILPFFLCCIFSLLKFSLHVYHSFLHPYFPSASACLASASLSLEGEATRPKTMVYKSDFSDSDDDDCYEYPEDPSPVANKSMTLPANISQMPPPRLPAPNPGQFAKPELTKPPSMARLPPNAVQLVQAPPKLPKRGSGISFFPFVLLYCVSQKKQAPTNVVPSYKVYFEKMILHLDKLNAAIFQLLLVKKAGSFDKIVLKL